ncbi:MAG: two-component system response regulator CreB [Verrucomicrobiales bacterium]|nr:two-component system response regulator CreB [Verrucomicrobiales bacterium]
MPSPQLSVLIVEDEPAIAETLIYSLETEGYRVLHVGTGNEALALLKKNRIDFVVLDVGLPDITGFEVCREIRKTSDVPILFLTAREGEIDRVVGLEIGGDDYVVKPFSPRELTARVQAILRRGQRSERAAEVQTKEDEILTEGRLTLLFDRYEARLDGEILDLARYEFGMLNVFLRHPGRVYTRDQLMELVWDEPESASDRTVDAHIKTLRRKFHEIDESFDPVRTHRGIGYSWQQDLS